MIPEQLDKKEDIQIFTKLLERRTKDYVNLKQKIKVYVCLFFSSSYPDALPLLPMRYGSGEAFSLAIFSP